MAQRNEYTFMTAGLTFRPIIPSSFLRTASETTKGTPGEANEYLELTINQKTGYSFGMVIRQNFTKRFALESGINFVRRNLEIEVLDVDSGFVDTQTFGISAYEVPLMAMVFIRLGDQLHMNTSLGASVDIGARSVANGTERMDQYTAIRKVVGSAIANLGFEWRTEENGSIYIGATYHQPFSPIADTKVNYFRDPSFSDASIQSPVSGTYLTLDLRYYFHESAEGREARRKKRKKEK
jgi:hypothetical protein